MQILESDLSVFCTHVQAGVHERYAAKFDLLKIAGVRKVVCGRDRDQGHALFAVLKAPTVSWGALGARIVATLCQKGMLSY